MALLRKKMLVGLLVISGAMTALCAAVLYLNFHPKRTHQIPGPNRVFAQAVDSADETLHVKAADWPFTFWQPFLLADAAWPERYSVARFVRSKDGSLVALLAQERSSSDALYVAAYDFKNHERFEAKNVDGGAAGCNAKVVELLGQRGGKENSPMEIPPMNSGLYEKMTPDSSSSGPEAAPFPTVSFLAVITIPLLALASWPFWAWYVDRQIKSVESNAPDPGQFGGLAVVGGVVMTAAVAAVLGLAIAWFAGRRKECWRGVRIFAWVLNGLGTALAAALLLDYIVKS